MAVDVDAKHIFVSGRSGSGKSAWVKHYLKTHAKRVIVVDIKDEYQHVPGFKRVTSVDQVRAAFVRNYRGAKVALYCAPARRQKMVNALCAWVRDHLQSNFGKNRLEVSLVIEEMNTVFPVHAGALAHCPELADLCSRGRHDGVQLIGVTQRPKGMNAEFRDNANEIVAFRQGTVPSQKAIAEELGFKNEDPIAALNKLEFYRSEDGELHRGCIKFATNGRMSIAEQKA